MQATTPSTTFKAVRDEKLRRRRRNDQGHPLGAYLTITTSGLPARLTAISADHVITPEAMRF